MRPIAIAAFLLAALLIACSGDDKPRQPDIIRSGPGRGETSAEPPEFLRSSAGGGGVVPVVASTATSSLTATGLTVVRSEHATVPADQAFILILTQPRPGPIPLSQVSARDQQAILDGLQGVGVGRESVDFNAGGSFGPYATITVELPLDRLAIDGSRVVNAVESVVGRGQSGVRFAVSDCNAALAPMRQRAIEGAKADAESLAKALSLTLGPVIAATEAQTPSQAYGPFGSVPCTALREPGIGPRGPSSLSPLESEPEVRIGVDLTVTYSIGGAGAPIPNGTRLSASGSGSATARPDEAYVVVLVSGKSGPFGPEPLPAEDRRELIAELEDLDIDEDDIEIASSNFGGPTAVSVELPVGDLDTKANDIVDAIEDVLGRGENRGVWFSHSNCAAVLAEAQKHAITDARRNAEALAGAAGLKLGELMELSQALVQQPYGPPAPPSCTEDVVELIALGGPYSGALQPLDAEPEFTVKAAVSVTYTVQ